MLIESKRYQAEELPQIYASRVTIVKLQRSRKDEEQRRKKNLPELGRRRWNSGGKLADGDSISPSNVWERAQQQQQ
jgi:hypothetical protein